MDAPLSPAHLAESLLDGSFKGLPPLLPPTPLAAIGGLGWNLYGDDLPSPVAVLREEALDANRAWMRRFLAATGARIAPHAKTTMSPQLFALQGDDGAWGLTVATVHHARVALAAGFRRLVLANEVVGGPELAWLAHTLRTEPDVAILPLVDSVAGVARLATATRDVGRPVPVLVEVGFAGGRAGCRTLEAALAVARAVAGAPPLALAGVEAYEGLIPGATPEAREARVDAFLDLVGDVAVACDRAGLFAGAPAAAASESGAPIVSAGGSTFFDLVAGRLAGLVLSRPFVPLLRSGCYLTGDHGLYAAAFVRLAARTPALAALGPLRPALEVWAGVLSVPEPGRVILGAGKRDIGIDAGLPVPVRWCRPGRGPADIADARVVEVNDQHAHVVVPADCALRVGDRVALGITHPCTTFDRWSVLLRVDTEGRVLGAVRTFFG
jgi:D-serine dehydratase